MLSRAAASSRWVEREINAAIEFETSKEMAFMPVVAQACSLEAFCVFLGQHEILDFEADYHGGLARLMARLGVVPSAPLLTDSAPAPVDSLPLAHTDVVGKTVSMTPNPLDHPWPLDTPSKGCLGPLSKGGLGVHTGSEASRVA